MAGNVRKLKAIAETLAAVALLAVAGYVVRVARDQQRPTSAPAPASCAQLYKLARSASDSLYVAIARGDCTR